ncbi:hypothetical protein [Pseudomonas sp. LB3P58]
MSNQGPLDFKPPRVIGMEDADVDPDGYIPLELLLAGIEVVIPLWPSYATQPDERDLLTVYFEQPGQPPVSIENSYTAADIQPQFIIPIAANFLQVNGVGELWYQVLDTADHPSKSVRRNLTIDHVPIPVNLESPGFPDANVHGYLNCATVPPLWEGVRVTVPPLSGFRVGDRVELSWRGYPSLNGSGQEYVSARKEDIRPALSDTDIKEGYSLVIEPYDIHVQPMFDKASAIVQYRIFRGRRLVGVSKVGLVKIDRIIPGEEIPCGP